MNRRGFIRAVSASIAGIMVAGNLPSLLAFTPQPLKQGTATAYLVKLFNAHVKGLKLSEFPKRLIVGTDMFKAFEGEITAYQRFTTDDDQYPGFRNLRFKSLTMVGQGEGWGVRFE